MDLLNTLASRISDKFKPFLFYDNTELCFNDLTSQNLSHLHCIKEGEVVALVGDFEPQSIANLFALIDRRVIIVPLTKATASDHEYYFDVANVNWIVSGNSVINRGAKGRNPLILELVNRNRGGLVLFSSGTTGIPKGVLHDTELFLEKFLTFRPAYRTLGFLLFDHIGGLNTLFHTLYNDGEVVCVRNRSANDILRNCKQFNVEVLPTTPTFLRMLLLSDLIPESVPDSIKVITYGTERMDQNTLNELCLLLPEVDFRQTYGLSELGIFRVKSESRNSLFMKVGGTGVSYRVNQTGTLEVFSPNKMLGYLNAPSPFDLDGYYDTKDVVEVKGEFIKIVGRDSDVINVGGLKFMASEIELRILQYGGIDFVKVFSVNNPVTGQHVEAIIQVSSDSHNFDVKSLKDFLKTVLPSHMIPMRIKQDRIGVSHRFKKE
jgi:long-chain acyl-CoA synthetase